MTASPEGLSRLQRSVSVCLTQRLLCTVSQTLLLFDTHEQILPFDRSNVGEGITGQKGQSVTGQKHRAFWLGVNFEVKGFKLLCDYMVPDSSLA